MELAFLVLLIVLMALALGSGFPVAFALPGSAILTILIAAVSGYLVTGNPDAFFAQGGPVQWLSAGVTNLRGVYWEVERDTLIAIPLFIFMGIMLQRSKIAEDLLVTMARLFGPIPGGLGISVVFVGALLAATTGIVGATVVAMGLISLPAMLRNNYAKPLATGTIAASGTLGQIIPPSIVLIILADQLASAVDQASTARKALYKTATGQLSMPSEFDVGSTSAGEMFLGALVPGLLLVALYMLFILGFALLRPKVAPAVHEGERFDAGFVRHVLITLVPPLVLIFLVLGSILAGVATVNQAGAIGAAGALIMAGYRLKQGRGAYHPALLAVASIIVIGAVLALFDTNIKNITNPRDAFGIAVGLIAVLGLVAALVWSGWRAMKIEDTLHGVMLDTAKTTSLVFIILLGAAMLTAAFRAFGGEDIVREFLVGLPGGFWAQFIVVMAVIFVLGFFLDFIEIAVVVVPIVAPILLMDPGANVTAVWLGVMIGLNIQTSFLTPPFGFALFYLRGVAPPSVRTLDMYKGVVPFISLQLLALAIVGVTPQLVNYLPTRVSLTSDTAPPPRNPRLQYCLEEYVTARLDSEGDAIRAAIARARQLDLSTLPKREASAIGGAFASAESAFALLAEAQQAEQKVQELARTYRPLHESVRAIEKEMRRLDDEIKRLEQRAERMRSEAQAASKAALQARIGRMINERDALKQDIPAEWESAHKAFAELQKIERTARLKYRRAADRGYEPVLEVLDVLRDTDRLKAIEPDLRALRQRVGQQSPSEASDSVLALITRLRDIAGTSDIASELSKLRRLLRASRVDAAKVAQGVEPVLQALDTQLAWRSRAAASLTDGLEAYETAISDTIGARVRRKLTREQALSIAVCEAGHRDLALQF